jgi:TonB family protein
LNDCRKIDRLLWQYPNISALEKDDLERHLMGCADCREAFETIKALANSAENDRVGLTTIDAAAFDADVMNKIRRQKAPALVTQKPNERYIVRMAFSFALAATVVLFLVKSISDLGELTPPSITAQKGENDNYQILNLQLDRKATVPAPPAGAASEGTLKKTTKALVKNAPAVESADKLLAEAPPVAHADSTPIFAMSKPVDTITGADTTARPESVSIGNFVLAGNNKTSDLQSQYRAASRPEFYAVPGSVQVAIAQSSVLVTIEKMPTAIKMVTPEYPIWAKKRELSGTVWIRARVENDGSVKDAHAISCDAPGLGFEESAVNAANESIFIPASSNGMNLSVWIEYPVRFICKNQ